MHYVKLAVMTFLFFHKIAIRLNVITVIQRLFGFHSFYKHFVFYVR